MLRRLKQPDGDIADAVSPTIGMDTTDFTTTMAANGEHVRLSIWDTAGQERFRSLTAGYYRNASAVIVVYDITNGGSFAAVTTWLDEAELYRSNGGTPVRVLVGNKSDMSAPHADGTRAWRDVSFAEGRAMADRHGMLWYECSAKCDGPAIQQLFQDVAKAIWSRPSSWPTAAVATPGITAPKMPVAAGCC